MGGFQTGKLICFEVRFDPRRRELTSKNELNEESYSKREAIRVWMESFSKRIASVCVWGLRQVGNDKLPIVIILLYNFCEVDTGVVLFLVENVKIESVNKGISSIRRLCFCWLEDTLGYCSIKVNPQT